MNVKINAKNMKYRLLFVVVYSIPFFSVEAQGVSSKGTLGVTHSRRRNEMPGLREIRFYNEGIRCTCFMI